MKTVPLHPASFAAGLAIAVTFVFLTSQTSAPTFPTQRVEVGPHPRDMVQIREGQPFTVPPGKMFVVTALGRRFPWNAATAMRVNGVLELETISDGSDPYSVIPPGFTIPSGSVIEVDDNLPNIQTGRVLGYVAER